MRSGRHILAALLSVSVALAATEALAQQARLRRETRIGVSVGPTGSWLPEPGKAVFGVSTSFVVNVPLSSVVDFRTGIVGDAAGNREAYVSAGAPLGLRFNVGSWYSAGLGAMAGIVSDTRSIAFYVGPEWSVATLRFGALRQFELELTQGYHFQAVRILSNPRLGHFQSSLMLTYFFVEPAPAGGSS